MQRFRWIALQGSSRGQLPPLLLFCLITTSGIPAHAADDPNACRAPVARIVSIQGSIEVLRASQNDWIKVTRLDTPLCEGDRLRTGTLSRAALFIQPETLVRVDQNTNISVSQTAEETLVEFRQEEMLPAAASAYTCGAGYFITRFPRKFRVKTPHLNAAVEGTEFLVAMRCESTELSVFEGKVLAAGEGGTVFPSQSVVSGQTLTIGGSEPPAIKLNLKPTDAVQWTLYYPPITPVGAVPVEDCRVVAPDNRVSCLIARAEELLRAGRVDEAQTHIGDALAAAPYSSDAKALSSIISLVRNDKAEALRLASEAVEATANSAPAWLALSYAQQADFKLEAALTSAQRAAELTPSSALALARVAELQLSLGWTREAEKMGQQAVAANPSESRAHMILGFVHLAQIKVKDAREDFEHSIELDSTDPLSRLGLGLAIIRKGHLVEGREQIEIAVALDPTNSLIRSYVGKAYYEENTKERDQLAAIQFGLAQKLDPKDPTPWFYSAILKQTQNQPVQALEYLQQSIARNDNRAIYRSRLMLDQDQATRNTDIARIYGNSGLIRPAIDFASSSVREDPANFSAHRLLSELYAGLDRHEVARSSELLQAQLLQPLTAEPISPQISFTDVPLSTINGVGTPSLNEYSSLFERDRLRLRLRGLAGNLDTTGGEMALATLFDSLSISVGGFNYSSNGFRENNDISHEIYNVFSQLNIGPSVSFQAEYRDRNTEHGDIALQFDPTFFSPSDRVILDEQTARLGLSVRTSPRSTFLASAVHNKSTSRNSFSEVDLLDGQVLFDDDADLYEMQYQFVSKFGNAIIGVGDSEVASRTESVIDFTPGFGSPCPVFLEPCSAELQSTLRQSNQYIYINLQPLSLISLTLGASHDTYKDGPINIDKWSPRLGIRLQLATGVALRLATFQNVKRALVTNQTIEPTQIVGFNQFFDDITGSVTKTQAAAMDVKFSPRLFATLEGWRRRSSVSTGVVGPALTLAPTQELRSDYGALDLNWIVTSHTVTYLGAHIDRFTWDATFPTTFPTFLETVTVPIGAKIFVGAGLSAEARATSVWQTVQRQALSNVPEGTDSFTVVDLSLAYRLNQRKGILSLDVRNLFDSHFFYQDDDFRNAETRAASFLPVRQVLLRLSMEF